MPFRIPTSYTHLSTEMRDPTADELGNYLNWLRRETITARAALSGGF